MVKAQKEEEVVVKEEEVVVEKEEVRGLATVYSKTGLLVREYSAEVHGKEYKKLADSYATKIGGTVK